MGGIGSGRPCVNTLASDVRHIDIRHLQSAGALRSFVTARWAWRASQTIVAHASTLCTENQLTLTYRARNGANWKVVTLVLPLIWSGCNFGGRRAWFECPAPSCGRKVIILYGDDNFVCRKCRKISYESQRIAPPVRALARAQTLRVKFGGDVNLSSPPPPKPKGMNSWTYTRRCVRIFTAERNAAEELLRTLPKAAMTLSRQPENP